MIRISAVIFDLDDTLTPESAYQASARRAVLAYLSEASGLDETAISLQADLAEAGPRTEYFQRLLRLLDIVPTEERVSTLIEVHREHSPDIEWYPDVIESTKELIKQGVRVGIITDGYAAAQHAKLRTLEAANEFEAIIVTDDLGREYWKPHPLPFLRIAEQLGMAPAQLMYVGDNPAKDFYIATKLPITTVRIWRPGQLKSSLGYHNEVMEQHRVASLLEIPTLVERLNIQEKNG